MSTTVAGRVTLHVGSLFWAEAHLPLRILAQRSLCHLRWSSPHHHRRRRHPPPIAIINGANLHRPLPHRRLLQHRTTVILISRIGALSHSQRAHSSPIVLVGLTRWRLQMTFSTFGKPSQQDFGTSLSTTWKRLCVNDCRGGAPALSRTPLWALRQLLLATAAVTYVGNGSITTTLPIASRTQVHPSSWMSATAYTNNF